MLKGDTIRNLISFVALQRSEEGKRYAWRQTLGVEAVTFDEWL